VVGARERVASQLLDDGVEVAPEDQVVDEPVAAAVPDLVVGVAEAPELGDVVLLAEVRRQPRGKTSQRRRA